VDQPRLSAEEFSSLVTAVTSAFGDPTRRQIYLFAHDATDGVTASEVAERFELHPNVARHHLDKLAAGGYLDVAVDRAGHIGAGRPSKRYHASEKDAGVEFPLRRDDLLVALLGRALRLLPPDIAETMAEEVGVDYGRALVAGSAGDGQRSFKAALHVVADALTAHGFAAHSEQQAGALALISDHCPFGTAAVESPVICAVHRGMVKGMLGTLYGDTCPATALSRAYGDDTCVTTF
jgi:predicted ArsR family transcriptional regulator